MQTPVIQPWALSRPAIAATGLTPSSSTGPGSASAANAADGGADSLARQFEQLLLRQMLSQMRSTSLSGDDAAQGPSAGYLQMADDQLAGIIAAAGGLGLGSTVRRWMQGVQAYQAAATQTPQTTPATQTPAALPKLPG